MNESMNYKMSQEKWMENLRTKRQWKKERKKAWWWKKVKITET